MKIEGFIWYTDILEKLENKHNVTIDEVESLFKRKPVIRKIEKGKQKKERDPLPKSFDSLAEAAEFWDTHDSADYEDMMEDVDFEVDIKRHIYFVPVAESIFGMVRERARSQGVSTETMVNLLLQKQAQ